MRRQQNYHDCSVTAAAVICVKHGERRSSDEL